LSGIAGVTATANIFVTDTASGVLIEWGATFGTVVGGVVLQGISSAQLSTDDFLFI